METASVPAPLHEWAKCQNFPEYEWRKPGVVEYDTDSDTWRVDKTVLRFVVASAEERFYCGLYEGTLEPRPVMYWAVLHKAMVPKTGV